MNIYMEPLNQCLQSPHKPLYLETLVSPSVILTLGGSETRGSRGNAGVWEESSEFSFLRASFDLMMHIPGPSCGNLLQATKDHSKPSHVEAPVPGPLRTFMGYRRDAGPVWS